MEPKPATAARERHKEQIRAGNFLELGSGAFLLQDGVAERLGQPGEDRGAPQEPQLARVKPGQVLGTQVVGEVAIVACEPR